MTIWQPELSNNNSPIYKKLADAIDLAIKQGELKTGEKLPPQRLLADKLGVTVGTVTRAYSESERRGSVVARVGSGTYVKSNNLSVYLSHESAPDSFDLQSAKAPMGPQLSMMSEGLKELSEQSLLLENSLYYQTEVGMKHQREALANWLVGRGFDCREDNLLFSYGGQHSLSIALQAFCRAGDTVLAEGLSFPGISAACQMQQLKCIGLAMDDQGIRPESLAAACIQSHPRVLYLTPQIQNPTCVQMSLERKLEIIALCQKYHLLILEDDVQFLPQADKVANFFQLSPQNTIYISSFSKSFSGGLRLGYLVTSTQLRERLKLSLRANVWTLPSMIIELVCGWLANGKMAQLETWLTQEMAERNQIMQQLLSDYEKTYQPHGFTVWLKLPEHWRAVEFVEHARKQGVLVRAAESYAIGRFTAPQNIRLCICAPGDQNQLKLALERLRKCLKEMPVSTGLVM